MLTKEELQVAKQLKDKGYSTTEVLSYIGGARTGAPSSIATNSGISSEGGYSLRDALGDVKETFLGMGEEAFKTGEDLVTRDIRKPDENIAERAVGYGADLFRGIGRVVSQPFVGAAKLAVPQKTEDAAVGAMQEVGQKVAESEPGQWIAKKYASLTPEQQEQVQNIMGYTEGLAELGGVRAATKVVKKVGQKAATAVEKAAGADMGVNTPSFSMDALRSEADKALLKSISDDVDALVKQTRGVESKTRLMRDRNTDVASYMKDREVFKGIKVDGTRINTDEAVATVQNRIDKLTDAKSRILPSVSRIAAPVSKQEVLNRAIQNVRGTVPDADEAELIARITRQVNALPESMSLVELDQKRALFRKGARDAKGLQKKGDHYSALENATRDLGFERIDELPLGENNEWAQLNNYIKDLINTREYLDVTLRGQVIKGGRVGGYSTRILGAIAGSQGGVFGTIAGAELGGFIQSVVMNNTLGSALKLRILRNLDAPPEAIRLAEELVKKAQDLQPMMLPAPSTPFRSSVGSGAPIPVAPKDAAILAPNSKVQVGGEAPTKAPRFGKPSKPFRPYDLYEPEGEIQM